MKYVYIILISLLASIALGADGDKATTGSQAAQSFILCDGATTSDRTCTEFDVLAKTGRLVSEMQFSIEVDTGCDATALVAISVGNQSGGAVDLLGNLSQAAPTFYTDAQTFRFISATTSGTGGGPCTVLTVWATFAPIDQLN